MPELPTGSGSLNSPRLSLEWSGDPRPHARYDIILIHGLRDAHGDAWKKDVQNCIESDLISERIFSVVEFRYDTSSNEAPIYAINGIEKEAMKLLDSLTKDPGQEGGLSKTTPSFDRELVFIARDIGGFIAKKALCIASRSPLAYRDILRRTCALIFYNCPYRSFDLNDVEDNVVQMLSGPGRSSTRAFGDGGGDEEERTSWQKRREADQVSYNFKGHAMIQCPLEEFHETDVQHSQLGLGKQDRCDRLTSVLRDFMRANIAARKFPEFKSSQPKVLDWRILIPESPPVRYPSVIKLHAVPFQQWSHAHEQFDDWLHRYHEGLCVVHLYSSPDLPELSEQVLNHVQTKQTWAKVLYFRFHPDDSRLNSTRAMLLYMLTQHMRWTNQTCAWPIKALPHAFSLTDLYQCFVNMVWTHSEKKDVWLIIGGIEHADKEFIWFLRQVHDLGSRLEVPLQLIATSNDDGKIMGHFKGFTSLDLSASPHLKQFKHDALMETTFISRRKLEDMSRPYSDAVPLFVSRVLEAHFQDPQMADMILQWAIKAITGGDISFSFNDNLGNILDTSPTMLFRMARDSLSKEQQKLAEDVSILVRTAFRPLTVNEIASGLLLRHYKPSSFSSSSSASKDKGSRRLVERIHQILPVLFNIQHGELSFAHDSILKSQQSDLFPSGASRHAFMTNLCLGFLRLPTTWDLVETLIHKRTADNVPGSESRRDFLSYAANHLISHYNLCDGKASMANVLSLFKIGRWVGALGALSCSAYRKSHRNDMSVFQCVAQSGIMDFATVLVSQHRQAPEFETECGLVMTEAASYGQVETVRFLLQELGHVVPALKEAVSAAASHGNEQTLNLLINFCSRPDAFDWPDGLLCRAAWLGLGGTVRKLLGIGLSLGWKIDYESSLFLRELTQLSIDTLSPREQLLVAPLAISLFLGHEKVVKIILETDKTEFSPGISMIMLKQAVSSGIPGIVRLMIDHSARRLGVTEEDELLQAAAEHSSYLAIEALIQAASDLSWHTETLPEDYAVGPLITAIGRGHIKCVKHLLLTGVKIDGLRINESGIGETALSEAVRHSRLEMARMILLAGADANLTAHMDPPLIMAIENEDKEMVDILLEHGADVEVHVGNDQMRGDTALAVAAGKEDCGILNALLQRGARVNYDIPYLWSPLYVAAFGERIESVKILLNHGAVVDDRARPDLRPTPLNSAYANVAIVKILLDHGADIDYISLYGTVLCRASAGGYLETVQALLSRSPKPDLERHSQVSHEGYEDSTLTPLCAACKYGHINVMRTLIEAGANVGYKAPLWQGMTPLHFCFAFVDQKGPGPQQSLLAILLYRSKLDVSAVDRAGRTALHLIDGKTPVSFVKAMVDAGASTEALNCKGNSPFARSIISGNIEVFEYLRDNSSYDPERGIFPLSLACAHDNADMVKYLVTGGADVNGLDPSTVETPLYALFTGPGASSDLVSFLVDECHADVNKPGGEYKYPIIKAFTCYIENASISDSSRNIVRNIRLLIERGADVNAADDAGRRAVHVALSSLSPAVPWNILEENGADFGARDKLGRCALHYAAALGSHYDFTFLADRAKVDINAVDEDGWTPLMWATQQRVPYSLSQMVATLKKYGADIWVTADNGGVLWSPLKLALFRGYFKDDQLLELEPADKTRKRHTSAETDKCDGAENIKDEEDLETWDYEIHQTYMGREWYMTICRGCFTECRGTLWSCNQCPNAHWGHPRGENFHLCDRCYPRRLTFHMNDHNFEQFGSMYAEELSDSFYDKMFGLEGLDGDYDFDSSEESETSTENAG